jgi:serine/threonine-protein kinase
MWEATAMTWRPQACDSRQLDLFLRDRLPEDSQRDIEAHLLACPACRDKLDELAGGPRWWTEVRLHLGGDGASALAGTLDPAAPRSDAAIELSFLEPSDKSDSLGRLGPYEIQEVLGRGGMGVVLKAFDPALHRPVAIKVLAGALAAHGAARKRFAREAQAAAAVAHDHVVAVYAVDADATPPYLVMAYIPGQSLQQRLDRSGPLELKEILRIGMQAASGLAAAHAQGIVHRDIKPANLMLENGIERVRLTDFGLARAVDDASLTQSGAVAGTPQYMAPEQAGGLPVDQRADLFALGSTLYAACTGRAPFRGDSGLAIIRQVCDKEPPAIRSINPDVPVWLEGIIRKLHAKDPAKRFQTAAEVANLLEQCLAHVQQPDAHPLPRLAFDLGRQVPRPYQPHHARSWRPVAAALTAVAICGVALAFLARPGARQQGPAGPEEISAESLSARVSGPEQMPAFDRHFMESLHRHQTQVQRLRETLTGAAGAWENSESPIDGARHRAEKLRRDWSAFSAPTADPVSDQLESIRRRLERLQQHVSPFTDEPISVSQ